MLHVLAVNTKKLIASLLTPLTSYSSCSKLPPMYRFFYFFFKKYFFQWIKMDTSPRHRQVNPLGPMGSSSGTGPLGSTWEDQHCSAPAPLSLCQNHCRWIQVPIVASKKSVEPGTQGTALFIPGSGTHWGLAWLWNREASSHQMACEQRA